MANRELLGFAGIIGRIIQMTQNGPKMGDCLAHTHTHMYTCTGLVCGGFHKWGYPKKMAYNGTPYENG